MVSLILRTVFFLLAGLFSLFSALFHFGVYVPQFPAKSLFDRQALASLLKNEMTENFGAPNSHELARVLFKIDKRNELARINVAFQNAAEGDFDLFIKNYLPLMSTDGKNTVFYQDILAKNFVDANFSQSLIKYISSKKPRWGSSVLEKAFKYGYISKSELIEQYAIYPEAQKKLINAFTRVGDWQSGYEIFTRYVGSSNFDHGINDNPFNPQFLSLPLTEPFNWYVNGDFVDMLPDGGVDVAYFGQGKPALLSQSFPLVPGEYEFQTSYTGKIMHDAGYVIWHLSCQKKHKMIAEHELKTSISGQGVDRFNFIVPESGCDFVRLRLLGRPGLFPGDLSLLIHNIKITGT